MTLLLGSVFRWLARHALIFLIVAFALIALAKAFEAYRAVPKMRGEVAALEEQEALLQQWVREERASAQASADRLGKLELQALQRRLAQVRGEIARADNSQTSSLALASDAIRGETGAIARKLGGNFRLQLLRQEEAALTARLQMLTRRNRVENVSQFIRRTDARTQAIERRITVIEREYPILSRGENVPILRDLGGPWMELRNLRAELTTLRQRRMRAAQVLQAEQAALAAVAAEYQRFQDAMTKVVPPTAELSKEVERKRTALSQHWTTTFWHAVQPVLGWAAWIVLLLILVPPAVKAFWFFVVAPQTARLRPILIEEKLGGGVDWLLPQSGDDLPSKGSAVSRTLMINPGDELLIKPEYLQGSMQQASIDTAAVLSWSIPFGSLATGMFALTRISVDETQLATLSATQDMFDEVAIIVIPEGSGLVFKPRNLVGILQSAARPVRIRRLWKLGHASSWLTLQLRYLLFEGPCALVVKGARGVVLEQASGGRRIDGAATMGWSPALGYSVRRSETFFAYLTGKQSLFNDGFEGDGKVIYEQMPRARSKGGIIGRGLEGLGDGLLKVVGL